MTLGQSSPLYHAAVNLDVAVTGAGQAGLGVLLRHSLDDLSTSVYAHNAWRTPCRVT